jgi:hypothetical protein
MLSLIVLMLLVAVSSVMNFLFALRLRQFRFWAMALDQRVCTLLEELDSAKNGYDSNKPSVH